MDIVTKRCCHKNTTGQTLIEFALAMPVLVAIFTLIFALGYTAYQAHSASSAARGLDMQWDALANNDDTLSIIAQSFADFESFTEIGPPSGFMVEKGTYALNVKWLPNIKTPKVIGLAVLPGDLLAPNTSSTTRQAPYGAGNITNVPFTPLDLGAVSDPMAFCNVDPKHCISLPLMDKKFPKILTMQDNCDTDIGIFTAAEPLLDAAGNPVLDALGNPVLDALGNPMRTDKVKPVDCGAMDPTDKALCYADKAKHAANYITQFVLVADKNKGCVASDSATLLLKKSDYPIFITGAGY